METFSRFSILSPDVDLNSANSSKASKAKASKLKEKQSKPAVSARPKAHDKANLKNKNASAKNKQKARDKELLALAFGLSHKKIPSQSKENADAKNGPVKVSQKAKGPAAAVNAAAAVNGAVAVNGNSKQNDDWNKRDEEFVKLQNEKSLREAILQSKLEFEEKKKKEEIIKSETEKEKSDIVKEKKSKKKKGKPVTISLDQFHSLQPKELAKLRDSNPEFESIKEPSVHPNKFSEERFFKDVEEATRRTLEKEHRNDEYHANASKINHEIQVKKFISEIEKRDFEIQALRLEVDALKTQLQAVKTRNKKLCEVISSSEMRSKGELVVELDKVTKRRDEFSEEIARLLAELEQERTKVSQLNSEVKKMQGKKRNADSSGK